MATKKSKSKPAKKAAAKKPVAKKPAAKKPAPAPKASAGKKAAPKGAVSGAAHEKKLLEMREDLMNIVHQKQELDLTEQEVGDEADQASASAERELMFELSDNERQQLDAIEAALRKIETGSYGLCEGCSDRIGAERLKAIPQARYCLTCQSRMEAPRG